MEEGFRQLFNKDSLCFFIVNQEGLRKINFGFIVFKICEVYGMEDERKNFAGCESSSSRDGNRERESK